MTTSGWIPPSARDEQQTLLTNQFNEQTPRFGDVNAGVRELPDEALMYTLEVKATGGLIPRYYQLSGSCVGFGAAMAYSHAQIGDVVCRGDQEEIKWIHPLPTYGVGRYLSGARRRGEGSFGAAQAKAVNTFGMLPIDDPRLPKPQLVDGWYKWSAKTEIEWSYSPTFPVDESELAADANKYTIQDIARAKDREEVKHGIAQGYGVTMACSFGSNNMRVRDGFLIAPWDTTWYHQQEVAGYKIVPKLGEIWAINNQWFKNAHPKCPYLSSLGVYGSYWILASTFDAILSRKDTEVFLHSNTKGFPPRRIDWGRLGIGE